MHSTKQVGEIQTMNRRAVALLSGGLDSMLAIAIVKSQGIEVEALNFQTLFGCCKEDARRAAYELGVKCTLLKVGDDYLKVIQKPRYGYGRGVNPCVDCRIYMFLAARKYMEETGASFLITGEVLDQRPMSQKKNDMWIIERDSGLKGRILRPLSAKLLTESEPERLGIVDRSKLFAIQGQSRKMLLELAREYGIKDPPPASAGCALTMPEFSKKVRDVFTYHPDYERWQFEALKVGRHFRLDDVVKVVVARNHTQNQYLESFHPQGTTLLKCENFGGPHALLVGNISEKHFFQAGRLMLRYSKRPLPERCEIICLKDSQESKYLIDASASAEEALVKELRIV